MSKAQWLLLTTAMLGVWNAGIIWFTQIAVYPLWPLVDAAHFHDYHLAWWHVMWPAFGPVGAMFLCSVALLWARPARISKGVLWAGILLQLAVHMLTIFFWAPIQATMATPNGISLVKYEQLMSTHWWRVIFFWAYAALMIWAVARSTTPARTAREL
jgi:hypothetical protein